MWKKVAEEEKAVLYSAPEVLLEEIVSHAVDKRVAALGFSDAAAVMHGNDHDKVVL